MSSDIVTAAVLLIGDEILSGRTKDANAGFIAERLTELGIDLKEIRVVSDDETAIVEAVQALSARYTYVFTTGGIGPTHDDITADAMAKAFNVGIDYHPDAIASLAEIFPGDRLNLARKRMARIPFTASLIINEVSKAPGFILGNVHVMAGVPSVMRSMFATVVPSLKTGPKVLSETILANAKEGDVGTPLGEIQKRHPDVTIGSYPFQNEQGYNTNLVIRGRDPAGIESAKVEVLAMLAEIHAATAKSGTMA
jgi:molybdenum cofactor synthesis domain-containing protein